MSSRLTPLERLRLSGVTPERALGQNFLIDPNILDVIDRAVALSPSDVVLEVGPGLGVLTSMLVEKCAVVHSIEVDTRLAALLQEEFTGRPGFRLHVADAVRFNLSSLKPPPIKFVANLPYSVAVPLVMKSFEELPSVRFWCLMVQKEIAGRLFAATGSALYGGVSVMTRLMAEKVSSRTVSGTVFYPRPRVRSSLLVFRRRQQEGYAAGNFAAVKQIVYAAFSHRRKKLSNSLAEAEPLPRVLEGMSSSNRRKMAEEMLIRLGLPAGSRPQALEPEEFEAFAALLIEGSPQKNHA